jgi:hypothetical protein
MQRGARKQKFGAESQVSSQRLCQCRLGCELKQGRRLLPLHSLEAFTFVTFSDADANSFEFAVSSVAAVPESSTWAMTLFGFAGVGFVAYRQSRKDKSHALAA